MRTRFLSEKGDCPPTLTRGVVLRTIVWLTLATCTLAPAQERFSRDPNLQRSSAQVLKAFRAAVAKPSESTVRVQCECGRADCSYTIEMPTAVYEDVRSSSARFVVMRDHGMDGVDRVVERRGRFDVVEAFGAAGEIARELDPRSAAR